MSIRRAVHSTILFGAMLGVSACGLGWGTKNEALQVDRDMRSQDGKPRQTIFGALGRSADPNVEIEVNKYLWNASLEVLSFLPIESVDPFTGVIVTGYGTPPGGGRAYRATVYIQDPALDARSLKVSLQTSGGASASPDTIKAVEDAILTRARQLRVRDSKL